METTGKGPIRPLGGAPLGAFDPKPGAFGAAPDVERAADALWAQQPLADRERIGRAVELTAELYPRKSVSQAAAFVARAMYLRGVPRHRNDRPRATGTGRLHRGWTPPAGGG